MSSTNNETTYVYEGYFKCSSLGEISLNEDVCGSDGSNTPEVLVIPEKVGTIDVTSFVEGMFEENTYIKEIILPKKVAMIPQDFCRKAYNLRSIRNADGNMNHITHIGGDAFRETRIKEVRFPNLEALELKEVVSQITNESKNVSGAFHGCAYLEVVDIGKVTSIPEWTFWNCAWLREVKWNGTEVAIGPQAFAHTRSLRELPLLAHATSVADYAFYYSRISTPLPTGSGIGSKAFPMDDNTTDFWSDVGFTPCRNKLKTKLSQNHSAWKDKPFLEVNEQLTDTLEKQKQEEVVEKHPYGNACAIFAVMHIHSALSGTYYSKPQDFVAELKTLGLSQYVRTDNWPGKITKVPEMFEDLGYRTEVCGNYADLTSEDYQKMVNALADGAYIYSQASRLNDDDGGHAVVIYGINDLGEVCVLDSDVLHEPFRDGGFERNVDIYTYTIPYQNIVGKESVFIIVYPPEDETFVEFADVNTFTSASLPSEYPENQVTICRVNGDLYTPVSRGILTAYMVVPNAYRTFMPATKAALYLQIRSSTEDKWLDWKECNHQDYAKVANNTITGDTMPYELSSGVNVCVFSMRTWTEPEEPKERFPEGDEGYVTTYRLLQNPEHAREEWQPNGSYNKYVRYATDAEHWGPWHIFTTTVYTPPADSASGEDQ